MKGYKRKSACAVGIIGGTGAKKKWVITSLIILAVVLLIIFKPWGSRPYLDLSAKDIKSVSVKTTPPNKPLVELTETQINKLVEVLHTVVIYDRGSTEPLAGQHVEYIVAKTDGTSIVVNPMGSLLNIDGVRYNAKYKPSQQLSSLANKIVNDESN